MENLFCRKLKAENDRPLHVSRGDGFCARNRIELEFFRRGPSSDSSRRGPFLSPRNVERAPADSDR